MSPFDARLLMLLSRLEWSGHYYGHGCYCPECRASVDDRQHKPTCILWLCIREPETRKATS